MHLKTILKEKVLAREREEEAVASVLGCAAGDPLCDVEDWSREDWQNILPLSQ